MRKVCLIFLCAVVFCALNVKETIAWNDTESHRKISERAVQSSVSLDLNGFIKGKYGHNLGLEFSAGEDTLFQHILNGSHLEDANDDDKAIGERAENHFHDPTRTFNEAGLYNYPFSGKSAAVWAHFEDRNLWDLESFYDYLELSFMSSSTEERLDNLEKTFRTAGHLMHLLQDMAVPAHTRNELYFGHTSKLILENILKEDLSLWRFPAGSRMESYLKENPRFIAQVPPESIPAFDHLTNYFDTKDYRSNPAQPVSGLSHGLAEYSNSNFLSEMQFFRDGAQVFPTPFPNPNLQNVNFYGLQLDTYLHYPHLRWMLPPVFFSRYIGRASFQGEAIEHLGRVSFFTKYAMLTGTKFIFLDENCYDDYLEKLVPKAVAYSAGLLEFLFRGDIDFEIDVSDTVPIAVTNNSEKDMDGLFTLYYDTAKGGRKMVADAEWQISIPAGATVQVSGPPLDVPRDLGTDQIFTLVFRGTLGAVEGAVTGKTTSFSIYDFACHQDVVYSEVQLPVPYEHFFLPGSLGPNPVTTNVWERHFECRFEFEDVLSDHTVSRTTTFTFKVRSTPAIAKKIGRAYVEGQWFTLNGNNNYMPGVVEYVKISRAPGEWKYVFDASGANGITGRGSFGNPPVYYDGLWRTDTGYPELFWSQIAAHNGRDECILEEKVARPDIVVRLDYPKAEGSSPEPNCPNADEIMDRVRSLCSNEYVNFYNDTLAMAAPHLPAIYNGEWQNYGIEIRYNILNLLNPKKGDGTIYDSPVTFTKAYGSDELIIH